MESRESLVILLAEDDPDDRLLTMRALTKNRLSNTIKWVENGEELVAYLYGRGKYDKPGSAPRPGLILLDLNMPRMDGREALQIIKADPALRRIPVVVLTTSQAEQDIFQSYELGVNAFVTKPVTFDGLAKAIKVLGDFWFEIVKLPPRET
ncbi:MAG: response regulator [Rhodothermales bacterium]